MAAMRWRGTRQEALFLHVGDLERASQVSLEGGHHFGISVSLLARICFCPRRQVEAEAASDVACFRCCRQAVGRREAEADGCFALRDPRAATPACKPASPQPRRWGSRWMLAPCGNLPAFFSAHHTRALEAAAAPTSGRTRSSLGRGARRPGRRGLMSNEPDSCTRATPSWGGQDRLQQVCSKPDQHEARRPASWCLLFFLSLRRKARSAGCMFRNIRARTQSSCAVRLRALRTPRCARIHSRRPMPPAHRERRLAIADRESPHSAVPSAA